jgi:hypothetical protein
MCVCRYEHWTRNAGPDSNTREDGSHKNSMTINSVDFNSRSLKPFYFAYDSSGVSCVGNICPPV